MSYIYYFYNNNYYFHKILLYQDHCAIDRTDALICTIAAGAIFVMP